MGKGYTFRLAQEASAKFGISVIRACILIRDEK
jgi:hypothetical protein